MTQQNDSHVHQWGREVYKGNLCVEQRCKVCGEIKTRSIQGKR